MERSKVRRVWSGWRTWRATLIALLVLTALMASSARAEETRRIDLNSASAEELASLPGVGPAKAQAIIAYRETAAFKSPEELIEVKGIGEKLFAQLKDKVTVGDAAGGVARGGAASRTGSPAADAKAGRTAAAR
ncbi:MAG: ComEA family DNA-binding protein [Thermodesulfobacteriota bacterium]